jgi:integration host factor subunit beta
MIKSDLVRRIHAQNPFLLLRNAEIIVDTIFDEITTAMARGERIELRRFGTFSVKVREARTGRNPGNGVLVAVSKKASPHLKMGKEMKERLNRREGQHE